MTSSGTLQSEADFTAAHNYPDFRYSGAECLAYFRKLGLTDSYTISEVPDVTAMALDPGWALPANAGRYAGLVPSGRVYIVPLHISESDPQIGLKNDRTEQRHVAILNGTAYYFQKCEG